MINSVKNIIKYSISYIYKLRIYRAFIKVFEGELHKLDIEYRELSQEEIKGDLLPDLFYEDDFQLKLLRLFEDEKRVGYIYQTGYFRILKSTIEMPSAILWVKGALEKKLLGDSLWALNFPKFYLAWLRVRFSIKPKLLRGHFYINDFFETNYYHWLIETLPRLSILEQAGFRVTDFRLLMPSERSRPAFVNECLDLVGWGANVERLESGVYKVRDLIVPTLTNPRGKISPYAADWLRNKILSASQLSDSEKHNIYHERIYIDRDDAPSRRVLNSVDMDLLMFEFGFVKMTMSGKSVREQAKIFSSAKYIVGIHGAALANVVFCSQGAKLLEIFMDGWFTKAFFHLSRGNGMTYGCFLANQVDGNLNIDTVKLKSLLSTMVKE